MKILSELLEDVKVLESHGNLETHISSISLDSRNIEQNSLFIALVGNVLDGHIFIDEVIKKGAKVIVYEKDLNEWKSGVTYIKVNNTHEVVGIIANNFYGNPSKHLKLVGVTGTNGKTTIVTLLYKLFKELGYKVGMISTIVNKIDNQDFETTRTTPDAINLNKLLALMVNYGCEYCFMEVSSHSVSEKRINGISFAGGVFTNLTLDHLDYHKTLDNYCEAKKEFFDMISATGFAMANIDDQKGEYMLSNTKAQKYRLSLKKEADFNERLETKLLGEFNIYNVLSVYAVAILLGQDKNKVKEIIKDLEGASGRFESIRNKNNITGIVDYAHTPDALENVLKTINKIKNNRKTISVIGCGGDRDKSKRPIMTRIGYEMSDILILTSDNPRTEKPEDILSDMEKGLPTDYEEKVEVIIDRHMAIKRACELAKEGDFVLVAGKGHEKYQEVNGLKTYFDDMEELEKHLK